VVALPAVDVAPVAAPPGPGDRVVLRALPGPRADWLTPRSRALFWSAAWTVGADADRVGLRLDGPGLQRADAVAGRELPSEGLVRGAVQVPPDARPVLFGPDHPTTGGYPVVAVVVDVDTDLAGQVRPGQQVRFLRV
jgi:allophanate hydrolase subunit 2